MRSRIEQVLEVLLEIIARRGVIRATIRRAEVVVATRRNIHTQTVHTKSARELAPSIGSPRNFEDLVARWLGGDGQPLKRALLGAAVNQGEVDAINRFFDDPASEAA